MSVFRSETSESDVSSKSSWSVLESETLLDVGAGKASSAAVREQLHHQSKDMDYVQVQGDDDKCLDRFVLTPNDSESSLLDLPKENASNLSLVPCNTETTTLSSTDYKKQRQIVPRDVFDQWERDFRHDKRRRPICTANAKSIFLLMLAFLFMLSMGFLIAAFPKMMHYGAMEARNINSLVRSARVQSNQLKPLPDYDVHKYDATFEKYLKVLEQRKSGINELPKKRLSALSAEQSKAKYNKAAGNVGKVSVEVFGPVTMDRYKTKESIEMNGVCPLRPSECPALFSELKKGPTLMNTLKNTEKNLLQNIKNFGTRLTKGIYRKVVSPTLNFFRNNTIDVMGKCESGIFQNTHLFLAIHIINDLLLLKMTGYLKDDVKKFSLKLLKMRQKQQSRQKKITKKLETNENESLFKKQSTAVSEASTSKKLMFPKRIKQQQQKCESISYIDLFQQLQNIKKLKIEYYSSLSQKGKAEFLKEERDFKTRDTTRLNYLYDKAVNCKEINNQLIFCLSYIQSRRRDLEILDDVGFQCKQTCNFGEMLDQLNQMEKEVINHFKNKADFILKGKMTINKQHLDIPYVVDILLARQLRLKMKQNNPISKDVSTDRYTVPIKSVSKLPVKSNLWPEICKPRISDPPGFSLKDYCHNKLRRLTKQSFSEENHLVTSEKKDQQDLVKCWKDKYEQLKLFWRSRQEYYDKRLEICKLIKSSMPSLNCCTSSNTSFRATTAGARILNKILGDVVQTQNHNSSKFSRGSAESESIITTSNDLVDNVFNDIKTIFKNKLPESIDLQTPSTSSSFKTRYDHMIDQKVKQLRMIQPRWTDTYYPCVCPCNQHH